MSALDGFYSTWNKAKDTFGVGTPTDGSQYNGSSSQLLKMKSSIESAQPDDRWQGSGSQAYAAVNKQHAGVYEKLADLDKKMAAEVTNAANVVTNGRNQLDTTKSWVDSAVNSLPQSLSSQAREKSLIPIAKEGITQVNNTVSTANGDMLKIGFRVSDLKNAFDELQNQKLGPGEKKGDTEGLKDKDGDGKPDDDSELKPENMEDLVRDALGGNKEAAAKVDGLLDKIEPNQLGPYTDPKNPNSHLPAKELTPLQQELISQMQSQMSDKSLNELIDTKNKLGEHGRIIGESMEIMSDEDVKYPHKSLLLPPEMVDPQPGGKDSLPSSVRNAIDAQPVDRHIEANPESTDVKTSYPSGEDLKKISELIQAGDEKFQQGSALDHAMMDRAADVLRGAEQENADQLGIGHTETADSIAQSIFNSAGRDDLVVHDMMTDKSIDPSTNHPRGEDFLNNLTKHDWTDDGQAARTLTDWIDDSAKSNDPMTQLRAGETAESIAKYLGNPDNKLLHLQESVFNNHDFTTAGERNPALIQSYAEALIPFQGELVGEDKMPGFSAIEDITGSDLTRTRELFSVLDSDHTAANNFNGHAFDKMAGFQKDFSQLAGHNPMLNGPDDISDQRSQGMARAGLLAGLIDGGALTEASARGADQLKAAEAAYELKKNAIGYVFGLGTGHIDHLGPLANAMGKDPLTEAIIGTKPTAESIHANPNYPAYGPQHYQNLATYDLAAQVVDNHAKTTGIYPPSQYLGADGSLLTPEEVVANKSNNPNLGPNKLDDYYHNLYTYLQLPANGNLAQSFDQFQNQFDNARKK
ncbi:EspA/EspE family type VII secretion system effector [Mycolicibacterium septicum]|uniref:TPR repeat region-containing protein n=1 Tax=Mycolicibacterium septicum TaxID=98668 RepID=UPI0023E11C13|nr:EspA/EspE family type VII secretion system effector [Mycolicibacterium septicum]MDF3340197.1 EspA/EspE family type VII secretion system effector [Mycolicibacterium septicum]